MPPSQAEAGDSSTSVARQRRDTEKKIITYVLLGALCLGIVVVGILRLEYRLVFSAAAVWGLAVYVTGLFLGFIFGIPRVAAANGRVALAADENQAADSPKRSVEAATRKSTVNSNLVEVSDWLTKIIVGVGLVELKQLSTYGESLARFMAISLAGPPQVSGAKVDFTSVAGAIALYFGVLGFITGYLLTRVFLAVIMNLADRDADEASLELQLPAGTKVPMGSALVSLRADLSDLQSKVIALITGRTGSAPNEAAPIGDGAAALAPAPDGAAPAAPATAPVPVRERVVLWVDDHPDGNALTADRLKGSGVQVLAVKTTKEALQLLGTRSIPVIISDMHRDDDQLGQPGGIQLLQALETRLKSAADDRPRLYVYCSKSAVKDYGSAALALGATLVTASTTDLLAELERLFGEFKD